MLVYACSLNSLKWTRVYWNSAAPTSHSASTLASAHVPWFFADSTARDVLVLCTVNDPSVTARSVIVYGWICQDTALSRAEKSELPVSVASSTSFRVPVDHSVC